ncbi:Hin recombinase [Streptomyces sp. N35]|uniref:Hin recombinase n=1 Tax=Streptomyces sp. N35 TaxID=2795730 RepID=UPI0018F2BE2C|nr:Hin recombinase [Streptomyces sp. N35]
MASDTQRAWCNRPGHPSPWKASKLTGRQRDEVRERLANGEKAQDLAPEYGVTARHIRDLA